MAYQYMDISNVSLVDKMKIIQYGLSQATRVLLPCVIVDHMEDISDAIKARDRRNNKNNNNNRGSKGSGGLEIRYNYALSIQEPFDQLESVLEDMIGKNSLEADMYYCQMPEELYETYKSQIMEFHLKTGEIKSGSMESGKGMVEIYGWVHNTLKMEAFTSMLLKEEWHQQWVFKLMHSAWGITVASLHHTGCYMTTETRECEIAYKNAHYEDAYHSMSIAVDNKQGSKMVDNLLAWMLEMSLIGEWKALLQLALYKEDREFLWQEHNTLYLCLTEEEIDQLSKALMIDIQEEWIFDIQENYKTGIDYFSMHQGDVL